MNSIDARSARVTLLFDHARSREFGAREQVAPRPRSGAEIAALRAALRPHAANDDAPIFGARGGR